MIWDKVADKAAADHVAFERDVVAGGEQGNMAFAIRHLAPPENPDLNHGSLAELAKELATEIVCAVVKRDDRHAAQQDGAQAFLGFLQVFRGGDDRAVPIGSDVLELQGDEIAAPQLTVDGQIEHGQVLDASFDLEPGADRPDVLGRQGWLGPD
jgi:hypothetical protein